MDLNQLLGCSSLMVGGLFLLQMSSLFWRKAGMGLIWIATGLAAYFFTHSVLFRVIMLLS